MSAINGLSVSGPDCRPTTASRSACVGGSLIYLMTVAFVVLILPPEVFSPESRQFILIIGLIGLWRYSWAATHLVRATIYKSFRFPAYRAAADALGDEGRVPHLYVLVTSYRMESEVNAAVYTALLNEAIDYGVPTTIVAAVTDDADEELLQALFDRLAPPPGVELVLMRQDGTGKRAAVAGALLAFSRRMPPPGSVVVFMDGDVVLPPGTLRRSLPFFALMPDLGGLTTDGRGITSGSNWTKEWFDMRFAQRHLLMCSLALSRRVLVLTGRYSIIRADLATRRDFIDIVENDSIEHWRFGRFQFLTGDDKSTWFWLLRNGWTMLYLPDVQVRSFETLPTPSLVASSIRLMTRWFGNMLRNNGRAIALGPRRMGLFVWWTLIDQRLSMWTSLTGPVFAIFASVVVSPLLLWVYLLWVMLTRLLQAAIIGVLRGRFSPYFPPLLYYTQVVGSIIKIYVSFRLDRQSWTRQGIHGIRGGSVFQVWLRERVSGYVNLVAMGVFLLAMALGSNLLPIPDAFLIRSLMAETALSRDDSRWIQAAIDRAPAGGVVRLAEGVYQLQRPLVIARDNVTLAGAGEGRTVLRASFPGDGVAVVTIRGEAPREVPGSRCVGLAAATGPDDRFLRLDGGRALAAADFVLLRAANDAAFLRQLGAETWGRQYPYLRQTLAGVAAVGDGFVALEHPVGLVFPRGAELCPIDLRRGVAIRDLTIHYDLGQAPDPADYENRQPDHRVDGLAVIGAAYPSVEDVEIRTSGRHAVNLDGVLAPRLSRVTATGAYNKGEGGNGYFRVARTYFATIEDLRLEGLRHLTIQWSSHHNVITGLDSDADVNFHGGFSHHNEVRVVNLAPRAGHPWSSVFRTPPDAHWAPPDGDDNRVIDRAGLEISPAEVQVRAR